MNAKDLGEFILHVTVGAKVIVVSNREPCIHEHVAEWIKAIRPASGMVTAIEPIVQAVVGTWISHGSGSADRLVVDKKGRIRPTERAKIHSPESMADEKGRRGLLLWPVEPSHMATLPYSLHETAIFKKRLGDISNYFALSGLDPYHSSTQGVALDWNISPRWGYTNRECTLRIFPWGDKFLDGLLGNDILGFHLQYHGNNFFPSLKAHKPPGT